MIGPRGSAGLPPYSKRAPLIGALFLAVSHLDLPHGDHFYEAVGAAQPLIARVREEKFVGFTARLADIAAGREGQSGLEYDSLFSFGAV